MIGDAFKKKRFFSDFNASASPTGDIHLTYIAKKEADEKGRRLVHMIWNGHAWSTPEALFNLEQIRNPVLAFD